MIALTWIAPPLDRPAPVLWEDVELYFCAWVPGTHAIAYFGPVSVEVFLPDASVQCRSEEWLQAQQELLDSVRGVARLKHANAVIGLEVSLDPFAHSRLTGESGLRLYAVGTAARLEAAFP